MTASSVYLSAWRQIGSTLVLLAATAATLGEVSAAGVEETRLVGLGANFLTLAPGTPIGLVEFDKSTGAPTPIAATIAPGAIGPNFGADSTGRLFNLFRPSSCPTCGGQLNEISLATAEVIGSVPFEESNPYVPFVLSDIAFDSEDRLHAVLLNSNPAVDAPPSLAQIDVATGDVTSGVAVASYSYSGLAFDADDRPFATATGVGLVEIDPATGDTTVIGGGLADFDFSALAFDRDGTLFALAADAQPLFPQSYQLLTVDPTTGATTHVGDASLEIFTIVGMDIVIPEPAGAALVLMGVVGWLAAPVRFGHSTDPRRRLRASRRP